MQNTYSKILKLHVESRKSEVINQKKQLVNIALPSTAQTPCFFNIGVKSWRHTKDLEKRLVAFNMFI